VIEMMHRSKKSRRSHDSEDGSGFGSVRAGKLASTIRKSIQESLSRGLGDPRIRGLVSITAVDVSPDLSQASVLVSVVPERHEQTVLHGLRAATGRLRR